MSFSRHRQSSLGTLLAALFPRQSPNLIGFNAADHVHQEYRVFQAREIRRESARSERRSRKIMLELDIPETRKLEKTDTIDSGIGMGVGSDCDEYEFAT